MARIGKKPVSIPADVEVKINNQFISVKGPKGSLERNFHHRTIFEQKGDEIHVSVRKPNEKRSREIWGTTRVLLANMVLGVTKGFEKKLEINGVGFRASITGKKLVLNVGFSHSVEFIIPENIEAKVEKNIISVAGIDKQVVGEVAAQIREIKKPEPYKGKGIKYVDEVIRRKAGKVVKSTAGTT
ncbi:50S ribosomal protein L6 [Patescibacteria group bacterium]|nr:50S ribosomal protein L6 [Patescibacteria group bacterium]MBU0963967.1 50S ribosomal protein L6 [Patescibacteria group bacterium]